MKNLTKKDLKYLCQENARRNQELEYESWRDRVEDEFWAEKCEEAGRLSKEDLGIGQN